MYLVRLHTDEFRFHRAKGDPRKSFVFKCCYKLLRETQHMLEDHEYFFYIHAQFDIIKAAKKGAVKIVPDCLFGEGAWRRWMVWKHIFTKHKLQADSAEKVGIDFNNQETVKKALSNDLKVMGKRLKELSYDNVKKAAENRVLARWIAIKQVSPYYAILSPILNDWLKERNLTLDSTFHLDFSVFHPGVTPDIKEYFNGLFQHEFRNSG